MQDFSSLWDKFTDFFNPPPILEPFWNLNNYLHLYSLQVTILEPPKCGKIVTYEWTNEQMNEWMNEQTNKQTNKRTNEQTNEWTDSDAY